MLSKVKSVNRGVVISAVAREFGLPQTSIRVLYDNGKLPLTNDKLAIAKALIDYYKSKERDLAVKREMAEADPRYQAELRFTREKADKQAMENAVMAGELVNTSAVVQVLGDLFGVLKQRLLVLPHKLSHQVIRCQDRNEAEHLLNAYIVEALNEITGVDIANILTADISAERDPSGSGFAEVSSASAKTDD